MARRFPMSSHGDGFGQVERPSRKKGRRRRRPVRKAIGLLLMLASCAPIPLEPPGTTPTELATPARDNGLKVFVDPRIELLSVVAILAGYGLMNSEPSPYRADVERAFGPYRDHAAVRLFAQMYPQGFLFHVPPETMTHLGAPPALGAPATFPQSLSKAAGGEARLQQFVSNLRDFADRSAFMAFFKAHEPSYDQMASETFSRAGADRLVPMLEAYYGLEQAGYNIVLMPLSVELGFASRSNAPAEDRTCSASSARGDSRTALRFSGTRGRSASITWSGTSSATRSSTR